MELSPLGAASAAEQPAAIYLALELSRASRVVAAPTPLADKISLHKLAAGDSAGLLALIARLRARPGRALGGPVAVITCYEAGYDGFWRHRRREAHGLRNHVLDPASPQLNRRARRAKTDRAGPAATTSHRGAATGRSSWRACAPAPGGRCRRGAPRNSTVS